MLKKSAGKELEQTFEGLVLAKVLDLLDDEGLVAYTTRRMIDRHVKKKSVRCIDNMNSKLRTVESRKGKLVKRVCG